MTLPIAQLTVNLTSYSLSSISYNGFSSLVLVVCFIPEVIPYFSGWVAGWVAGEVENIAISTQVEVLVDLKLELSLAMGGINPIKMDRIMSLYFLMFVSET